jgi:hypothetical protein
VAKYILLAAVTFCLTNVCQAHVTVKGTVQDSVGAPIPNVSVYATGPDSVSINAGTYTN